MGVNLDCAVIGGTGHIGLALLHRLRDGGERVLLLHRPGSDLRPAAGLIDDARPMHGPMHRDDRLEALFSGVRTIFHLAGYISIGAAGASEARRLYRANVELPRRVLSAARAAGVETLVYTSSIEAMPLGIHNGAITEDTPVVPEHTLTLYGRTKARATLELGADDSGPTKVITVYPTAVVGPYDYRPSATGALVRDYLRGRLPAWVTGGFDFVDVRDVAEVLYRAARTGGNRRRFLASGRYVEVGEFMDLLEAASGRGKPLRLPRGAVAGIAPLMEGFYRVLGPLLGVAPRFTRESLALLGLRIRVDAEATRRALDYFPRPFSETVADTVGWFRDRRAR